MLVFVLRPLTRRFFYSPDSSIIARIAVHRRAAFPFRNAARRRANAPIHHRPPLSQTSIDVVMAVRMPRPVAVKAGHAVPDKRKHRPIEVGIQRIPHLQVQGFAAVQRHGRREKFFRRACAPGKKTAACPPSTSITVTTCRAAISTLRPLRGTIRYSRFTLLSTATIPASVRQA